MAVSEEARHALYRRLEEVLGLPEATTMMESVPPVGWGDVATRRDLDMLETRLTGQMDRRFGEIDRRFGDIDRRFGEMHERLAEWNRTVIYANLGAVLATASMAFAAARFS